MRVFDDDGMLTPAVESLLSERLDDVDADDLPTATEVSPFDVLDLAMALAAVSDAFDNVVHR